MFDLLRLVHAMISSRHTLIMAQAERTWDYNTTRLKHKGDTL